MIGRLLGDEAFPDAISRRLNRFVTPRKLGRKPKGDAAGAEAKGQRRSCLRNTCLRNTPPDLKRYMTAYEVTHYLADDSNWGNEVRHGPSVQIGTMNVGKMPLLEAQVEFKRIAEQRRDSRDREIGRCWPARSNTRGLLDVGDSKSVLA